MTTFNTQFHPEQIDPTAFIAPGAMIVGDVTLAEETSVWYYATLRGDTEPIKIGARTNIQEGSIFHVDPGFPLTLGEGVTVGHGAVVHGATVGNNSLIGIRSVVLNGVVIGDNCLVGANALLTQGKEFPAGSLILGSPAKVVRELTPEEIEGLRTSANTYVERSRVFMAALMG